MAGAVTVSPARAASVTVASSPSSTIVASDAPGRRFLLGEPVALREQLRGLRRDEPAAARSAAPGLLARHASDVWSDELESLGIPTEVVTHAFTTLRREIWLWLDGDRRWDQLADHLSARVLRRVPVRQED
jgi:hypothetical protein